MNGSKHYLVKGLRIAALIIAFCLVTQGVLRWQRSIQDSKGLAITEGERLTGARGLCLVETELFFYFYYYLDLLPITSTVHPTAVSRKGVEAFAKENGRFLANDLNRPCAIGRAGDWGKFFLLLPNAWQSDSPLPASSKRATSFLFKLALVVVLASAFLTRRYALGIFLVILVGSYRFQLNEAYFRDNVFSISITSCLLLLALNLRFMSRNASTQWRGDFTIAPLSGILLGCTAVIRGDALPMSLSVLAVYILSGQGIRRVAALCFLFSAAFLATSKSFEMYFDHKVREANQFVLNSGGTLYAGTALNHHPVWHPIAAGLGDFGEDRGFFWKDEVIFKDAADEINRKHNRRLESKGYYYAEPGMAEHEWLKPELMPEYIEVVRERVVSTIKNNPWWYADILTKRWQRITSAFSTVRITWANGDYSFPLSKWIFCPILLACALARRLDRLKLVAFSLPTCFVPMFITSLQGTPNYAICHLVAMAVCIDSCLFLAYWLFQRAVAFRALRGLPSSSESVPGVALKNG
jgi:hypothetical protein